MKRQAPTLSLRLCSCTAIQSSRLCPELLCYPCIYSFSLTPESKSSRLCFSPTSPQLLRPVPPPHRPNPPTTSLILRNSAFYLLRPPPMLLLQQGTAAQRPALAHMRGRHRGRRGVGGGRGRPHGRRGAGGRGRHHGQLGADNSVKDSLVGSSPMELRAKSKESAPDLLPSSVSRNRTYNGRRSVSMSWEHEPVPSSRKTTAWAGSAVNDL